MKGIMKLKVGTADGMSSKKLRQWLTEAARDTNRAKNAMLWYWMQWRREHPDWEPEQRRKSMKTGELKFDKKGEPEIEHPAYSQQLSADVYSFGRETSPRVASKVLSQAWSSLLSDLRDSVPYHHEGKAEYVWQALLSFERSLACYRSSTVPVPSQDSCLFYLASHSRKLSTGVVSRIEKFAGSSPAIRFPLWSRESGHAVTDVICRVNIGKMSVGHRRMLRRIASGEVKFSDSELVERNGKWYLHLCYELPVKDYGLDPERVATLVMGKERAFYLEIPDGGRIPIGSEIALAADFKRTTIRRKAIEFNSRNRESGGHGRNKHYKKTKPLARRNDGMAGNYRKHFTSRLLRSLVMNGCGKLIYREPTMPLRNLSWFAEQGVPFNWTFLCDRIVDVMTRNTIKVEKANKTRMGIAEWKERNNAKQAAQVRT